ncbi:hypothetical protein NPIL_118431 [Nephila pilipes]|uniref:Uncharacterized protein n=1 Tax=Nephila pilipes TaxID=299642 RepID=A0A8X6MN70_NEPPI|nr:hypothetical protein NPIL_118431 [Nephila pilipes]
MRGGNQEAYRTPMEHRSSAIDNTWAGFCISKLAYGNLVSLTDLASRTARCTSNYWTLPLWCKAYLTSVFKYKGSVLDLSWISEEPL